MRIAITGAAGLFGHALAAAFASRHTVFPLTRAEADITDAESLRALLGRIRPEVVVHPAGIPDLDIADADPARARRVNVEGTRHVVESARAVRAEVVYISTDAVFNGQGTRPYVESDPPAPITVYGQTKLDGEAVAQTLPEHWIFRVPVLFGPGKTNFIEKGLRKIAAGEQYVVASDQKGCATYTLDAAYKIMEVVEARRYGLYHLANQGTCTRYELARRAAEFAGLDPARVVGVPADQMGRRAPRLKYAVMEMAALRGAGFTLPRPWPEALADYIGTLSAISRKGPVSCPA
jgi:dTDP-4-dehydrorhamnose reductase